jgi:CMP-N-acetylneuraminic acid synthetase
VSKHLAIIPARGGSKRLPGKNTKKIGDATLVQRVIQAAYESNCFSDILLTTDSDEIIKQCQHFDNLIIHNRSAELAGDKATVLQVVLDIMSEKESKGLRYDTVTVMLPTVPFRKAEHIVEGFNQLDADCDGVLSVKEYDFSWHLSMGIDDENFISPYLDDSPLVSGKTRTQDQKKIYHPNGIFYIFKWDALKENKSFFKGKLRSVIIDKFHSWDIDEPEDFDSAQYIHKYLEEREN